MKINPNIFKAYDIRGKYPTEINEEISMRLGNAAARFFSQKLRKKRLTLLVCRDVRNSSPSLAKSLMRGILTHGSKVVDAGVGTTPYFYFLMHRLNPDGGIMVTASHNPPEYNGFKIRSRGGKPVSVDTGLKKIRAFLLDKKIVRSPMPEVISYENCTDEYMRFIAQGVSVRPIRAVIDAGGGSAAYFLPRLLNNFPDLNYKPLFFESDGSFKKHPPNPLLPEAQRFVKEELKQGQFRFGAIFDGDGDRVLFFDERGNFVRSEFIMGLFAEEELKKHYGGWLVMPVNTSRGVREYLGEKGAKIQLSRVGYTFVGPLMKKRRAEYGAEISGHFYFKKFGYDESALYAFLLLASLLSKTHRRLSDLAKPFERYISSGEINFAVKNKKRAMSGIKKYYRDGRRTFLDGITVEYPDWWFNLRPSNTEPLVRLVVEAKSQKLYDEKLKEIEGLVKNG